LAAPTWIHQNSLISHKESQPIEPENLNEKRAEQDIFSQAVASAEIDDFVTDSGSFLEKMETFLMELPIFGGHDIQH